MFENILGNDLIKNMLKQSIVNSKISHSYLMVGLSGIGKKMLACEYAKAVLCFAENNICNNCKSCMEFNSNNHPDFLIIEPDGNSIKIEQIRELQKRIQEKPIISDKKVYIIDNADLMTKEAQNCLLKTLEEPPEFAVIILIGSNENAFLTTIKSRCMILHFNPIEDKVLERYLKEQCYIEDVSENILDMAQGSIGKAIYLKDKKEQYIQLDTIIADLSSKDLIDIYKLAEILYKSKEEINEMLDYINIILLKKAKVNYLYTKCIAIVESTKKRLQQNANYDMCIDDMLFKMWEEVN